MNLGRVRPRLLVGLKPSGAQRRQKSKSIQLRDRVRNTFQEPFCATICHHARDIVTEYFDLTPRPRVDVNSVQHRVQLVQHSPVPGSQDRGDENMLPNHPAQLTG